MNEAACHHNIPLNKPCRLCGRRGELVEPDPEQPEPLLESELTTQTRLGRMLTLYLAARGITQNGFAAALGVHRVTVRNLLSGNTNPQLGKFLKLLEWMLEKEER